MQGKRKLKLPFSGLFLHAWFVLTCLGWGAGSQFGTSQRSCRVKSAAALEKAAVINTAGEKKGGRKKNLIVLLPEAEPCDEPSR